MSIFKKYKMINKTSELVTIFHQDGEKIGLLYQNGQVEMYTLKKASKQDVQDLLEVQIQ